MSVRLCRHCEKPFKPNTATHVFCNPNCRVAHHNRHLRPRERPCQTCGKNFIPTGSAQHFCHNPCLSPSAIRFGHGNLAKPVCCSKCGEEFLRDHGTRRICATCRERRRECRNCGAPFKAITNQRYCDNCSRATARRVKTYRVHKADRCDRCGFVATNACQLDVHHRNGNSTDNDSANLQTLCANCHRLVSYEERRARQADRTPRDPALF